jgi:hypothetical protein
MVQGRKISFDIVKKMNYFLGEKNQQRKKCGALEKAG